VPSASSHGAPFPRLVGRLELTWTIKSERPLAHETGTSESVSPPDYRVAEVRPLHAPSHIGEFRADGERAKDLLIRGDALNALTGLSELPELRRNWPAR
jgi:adenine-specific DNA-methyltransferase